MLSWNRYPVVEHSKVIKFSNRHELLSDTENTILPFGNGRSYGDVCLNENGVLLQTRSLDRFILFDRKTGRLRCEAGVLLKEILELVVPQGWFLPVTPGTSFVTVGGAVACDVHGKNHHIAGSFGHHVLELELLRSDGQRIVCGPAQNIDWFSATVGGLGLTGLIVVVEMQLVAIQNPFIVTSLKRFENINAFWLQNEVAGKWPYTVSWLDCLATGQNQGRGIFMAGQHAPALKEFPAHCKQKFKIPVNLHFSLVNGLTVRLFNFLYYHRVLKSGLSHFSSFFYPLDCILEWNRIYGQKGFFQYQCVLPMAGCKESLKLLLNRINKIASGSFLAVLKVFGDHPSVGMLSFPRPGVTLALDFPNRGANTLRLFNELDAIVFDYQGALYPAKDTRMSPEMFRFSYPLWEKFINFVDPAFSSNFWRRVVG